MRVMVVGSGGREHAIAEWLASDDSITDIGMTHRHDGACQHEKISYRGANEQDIRQCVRHFQPAAIMIGPEQPLVSGLAQQLREDGFLVVGPNSDAAMLEGSKIYAKKFCQKYQIPTASAQFCHERQSALTACRDLGWPVVIKADGLAGGKGVVIAENEEIANQTLQLWLEQQSLGGAGQQLVIERCLQGKEVSMIALVLDQQYRLLASAQDYKRRDDGNQGPNTGGMGCYAPNANLTKEELTAIETKIIQPTLAGLAEEQLPYCGWLYFGIMLTAEGPQLLEYNCRLGDPEAQTILPLLDCPASKVIQALSQHQLPNHDEWQIKPLHSFGVIIATRDYPQAYPVDIPISGLCQLSIDSERLLYHSGTYLTDEGKWHTSGGRVLFVGYLGQDLALIKQKVYHDCQKISWSGSFYRRDIGF